jgi:hypothetical protein
VGDHSTSRGNALGAAGSRSRNTMNPRSGLTLGSSGERGTREGKQVVVQSACEVVPRLDLAAALGSR